MKVHEPERLTEWELFQVAFDRVRAAALAAGLDHETFHELVNERWSHDFQRAYATARTLDARYADFYRWRWRSHALRQIDQYTHRTEEKK